MKSKLTRLEAATALHDYDHAFMSGAGVREFARIFGVSKKVKPFVHKANPTAIKGLSLNGGDKEAEGMCAAQFACEVCRALNVEYPSKFGRGSQLHAAASALEAHFEAQDRASAFVNHSTYVSE